MKTYSAFPLLIVLVFFAGCGGNEPGAPGGEVIVLAHDGAANGYVTPLVEAVAVVEGQSAETDASGGQRVALKLPGRTLSLVDYQSHEQIMQRLQADGERPMAAILVMMGTHGIMPDQEEQLQQAHNAGVPVVAVLQSQIHLIDDLELLDLEELEAEEALTRAGYPAGTPLRRASAVKAGEGDAAARNDIAQFVATLRQQLTVPSS
jgi:hypothetical protein